MLNVRYEGRIAYVELGRPPVNALDDNFVSALGGALDEVETSGPSVICIRSTLKVFAAGADLAFLARIANSSQGEEELESYLLRIQSLFAKLEALDAITIAEIGGAAMGAGLELALSCDLRVVANSAKLALPEVGIGLLPAAGGTQRLTRLCGRAHAIRMICAGDTLTSEQAYSVGLADYTVADQDLRNFVDELARRIAVKPAPALRMAKRCILAQNSIDDDGFAMERLAAGKLLRQEETRALIQKFLERSAQRASGR